MKIFTAKKLLTETVIALAVLLVVMGVCVSIGSSSISLGKVLAGPGEFAGENVDYEIASVRLSRVILAAFVGAALAAAGVIFQAILRNPLADPFILGVSSGAGLGVILAVTLGLSSAVLGGSPVSACAFVGALATVWLVWVVGHMAGGSQVTSLLLAGVVINSFFSAVMMFLVSISSAEQVRTTVYWLMGNISDRSSSVLAVSIVIILGGLAGLGAMSKYLNVLTFGDSEAKSLGVDAGRVKFLAIALASLVTAVAVSLSGLIGFVGLIVPHGVRLVFGPDHRRLLPMSAITGACFLVIADTAARTVLGSEQLPVGVITAIVGGPFFLILLARYSRKVSWLK